MDHIARSLGIARLGVILVCVSFCACAQTPNKATTAGIAGAALGAGLGAIVGNQSGHAGRGIAIGAAAGALGGALLGNQFDQLDNENEALQGKMGEQEARLEENRRLIDELRRRGADVRSSKRGVVINLPDVLFDFDRDQLRPTAYRTVDDIGEVLRDVRGRQISVEGHTDSVGSVTYNKDLSFRRAEAVAGSLVRSGIRGSQVRVRGFGEGAPIATNNTETGRSRNRRVEVIVEN